MAAAMSIAGSFGLAAEHALVLHNSNKLALRLLPCDVFARVAPVAEQVAQFEVELAQRLAEAGCPVAALESRVDPVVYERDGFVVTLWTYYEPSPGEVSPADYAGALERLHAGMRKIDIRAPNFTDRVEEALGADRARLGHAVADRHLRRVHRRHRLAHHLDRAERAGHHPGAQRGQVEALEFGVRQLGDEHRRHAV